MLANEETAVINRFFEKRQILARITKSEIIPFASFVYSLQIAPSVSIATIEGIERELCNVLYNFRSKRHNVTKPVSIRIRDMPLALEVAHPSPVTLIPTEKHLELAGLMGKSCVNKGKIERLDLSKNGEQHTLIAALSGGGKSSLMKSILSTMLLQTSFDVVKVVLIDLKNTDLYPFRALPHTLAYASTVDEAINAINWVKQECERRKQSQQIDYRLFLVFDELAELTKVKSKVVTQAMANLSSIMSVGRSLDVCTLCATQYPNKQTLDIVNTGFQQRFVGKMDSVVSANVAAKRSGSGAEGLTNPGDFVRVTTTIERFKAFLFDETLTEQMVNRIEAKWRKYVAKDFGKTSTTDSSTTLTHTLFNQIVTKKVEEKVVVEPSTIAFPAVQSNSRTVEPVVEVLPKVEESSTILLPKVEAIDPEILLLANKIEQDWQNGATKNRLTRIALDRDYAGSYKTKMDKVLRYLEAKHGKN